MELMIAQKIKKYRKERELTQDALASALGISPQSVSKWECGDGYPDITMLPTIANYFEITVDELIGNDEISAEEDIKKNYFRVHPTLDKDAALQLALKYNQKYPRNWHIANSLMHEIVTNHRDKLDNYKPLVYELCERLLKECTDSVMRRSAIQSVCMICPEDEINFWLNKDTTFWHEKRYEVFQKRYKLMGDKKQLVMYQHANNFLSTAHMLHTIQENRNYRGFPDQALEWNKMYLRFLDTASDVCETQTIPDGWLPEYALAYMRLSSAFFAVGETERGYEHIEKAIGLAKQYQSIPDGQGIDLGNSTFYGETKAVKNKFHIALPNGKTLPHLLGIAFSTPPIAQIMEATSGWEWFDSVRNEERYLALIEKAKSIAE